MDDYSSDCATSVTQEPLSCPGSHHEGLSCLSGPHSGDLHPAAHVHLLLMQPLKPLVLSHLLALLTAAVPRHFGLTSDLLLDLSLTQGRAYLCLNALPTFLVPGDRGCPRLFISPAPDQNSVTNLQAEIEKAIIGAQPVRPRG